MIFQAKNFKTRSDLENEVRNKLGLTSDAKPKHSVEGSVEDMKRLHLSNKSVFWGITCTVTDAPEEPKTNPGQERPNRGEVKPYGIGTKINKPKN